VVIGVLKYLLCANKYDILSPLAEHGANPSFGAASSIDPCKAFGF